MRWRTQSLRARLTLWYSLSVAGTLIVYSAGIYLWQLHDLTRDLDIRVRHAFNAASGGVIIDKDGTLRWRANFDRTNRQGRDRWLEAWSVDGKSLYSGAVTNEPVSLPGECLSERYVFQTRKLQAIGPIRSACKRVEVSGRRVVLRWNVAFRHTWHGLRTLLWILFFTLPAAVLVSAAAGYLFARRLLSPIGEMVERARAISAERLNERLPIPSTPSSDELGLLARTFNETFARLEQSFKLMKRFTADASHELRTPLTAIRSVGEVYLRKHDATVERSVEASALPAIASMLEEADHMQHLIDSLLTLSRADAGEVRLNPQWFDFTEMVKNAVEHLSVLAEERGQTLVLDESGSSLIRADNVILRRAVVNLIDNAIKYSPASSDILIKVFGQNHRVFIEVHDKGPGIAVEHQPFIFERFYRVDGSRDRKAGGTGLGLAITRWAVELHGGAVELKSRLGEGSLFRAWVPAGDRVV